MNYKRRFRLDGDMLIEPKFYDRRYENVSYNLNKDKYRSEEFINFIPNESVLFSGCSVTFGEALPEESIWPKLVYNSMINHEICSDGYFNLGVPGLASQEIIVNCFNFFKLYGNPKYLVICFPDAGRGIDTDIQSASIRLHQFYKLLNIYCNAVGIRLFAFTWCVNPTELSTFAVLDQEDNFYTMNSDWLESKLYTVRKNIGTDLWARDKIHFGEAHHYAYSDFIFDKILEIK